MSRLAPEPALTGLDTMMAQWARGESQCIFCHRPWFGIVAYCPYCGHNTGITTVSQGPGDRLSSGEAVTTQPGSLGTGAGELSGQEAKWPYKARRARLQGVTPDESDKSGPTQVVKTALTLLFKAVVAGVTALVLIWLGIEVLAPKTNDAASSRLPISSSDLASPSAGRSTTGNAQAPSVPPRIDTAPPRTTVPARTGAAPPPNPARSLCSVADERAGLCKSQQ